MKVRFLNLAVNDQGKKKRLLDGVERVLTHGWIVMGPEVEELEKQIAVICGVKYAIGVNSGTDALYFALRSIGIGPGDEVITTCLSWIATANAISLTGAQPVFVDVKTDFNIDPAKIREAVTPRTRAIVPVHFTGKVCDMNSIMEIARDNKLSVVEDAAQAFGASYRGKRAGSFGVVSAFSMNPMKVFAACGEAGMVVTSDFEVAERIKALRYNGTIDRMEAHYVSLNGRLDTLQAAILLERLKDFDESIKHRRKAAAYYSEALDGLVRVPQENDDCFDVYYTYNVICERRDELQAFLTEKEVETKVHHPLLMPMHAAYKNSCAGCWPVGSEIVNKSLCLPLHEKITREEQDYVIKCVREFYGV